MEDSGEFTFVRKNRPYRILSLDGGGVRAVMQAVILNRLVKLYPNLLQEVDMFTGTSAGAIVAAALAVGVPPEQTVTFYEEEVGKIFSEGAYKRVLSIDNTIGACYSNEELKNMLLREMGDKKLSDLTQKILIPTFHLDCCEVKEDKQPNASPARWRPEFYHNLSNSKNSDTSLVDAVLKTTAAPTYFPICNGFIDGGVVANNPALTALSTLLASNTAQLHDVVILSLSTGSNPKGIPKSAYKDGNWGLLEWGPHIIDLLLDSSTEAIDYQCRCILTDRYHRVDPLLPNEVGLDDASAVPKLKEFANQIDLSDTIKWIQENWKPGSVSDTIPADSLEPPAGPSQSSWSRCTIM